MALPLKNNNTSSNFPHSLHNQQITDPKSVVEMNDTTNDKNYAKENHENPNDVVPNMEIGTQGKLGVSGQEEIIRSEIEESSEINDFYSYFLYQLKDNELDLPRFSKRNIKNRNFIIGIDKGIYDETNISKRTLVYYNSIRYARNRAPYSWNRSHEVANLLRHKEKLDIEEIKKFLEGQAKKHLESYEDHVDKEDIAYETDNAEHKNEENQYCNENEKILLNIKSYIDLHGIDEKVIALVYARIDEKRKYRYGNKNYEIGDCGVYSDLIVEAICKLSNHEMAAIKTGIVSSGGKNRYVTCHDIVLAGNGDDLSKLLKYLHKRNEEENNIESAESEEKANMNNDYDMEKESEMPCYYYMSIDELRNYHIDIVDGWVGVAFSTENPKAPGMFQSIALEADKPENADETTYILEFAAQDVREYLDALSAT